MASTESLVCDTLDLSGQNLKKLARCPSDAEISTLILDDNELQRLDNLDSYHRINKLSIVRNQLLRMYGVSKLHNLVTLNLANNGILTIEGIKEMINLQTLCLAGNNIKSIEHLHSNTKLEHLDLSENSISHISDISYLRNLKELFLHNNRIITLRQCERYLPTSLETFTLANNSITDLNEMSHLANLKNLVNFSIANNPCVSITGNSIGFDYRPFVINWCMSLKSIDGYAVDPLESLKAEWLYSQGRGRQFRVDSSRNSIRMRSPDRMVSSCHTDAMVSSCHPMFSNDHESLMTQSLDPNMLCNTLNNKTINNSGLEDMEETSSPLQAATKLVPVPESLMSPDFRPPSGLSKVLPKTPPSKLNSPCQITIPAKTSTDGDAKAIPIINTVNPMAKTNLGALKANALVKSNSATNCSIGKPSIAKPIITNANGKCPHSVKINNYVQSKTLPVKRSSKGSPYLGRNIQRPKSACDRNKSSLIKRGKDGDGDNAALSSDEDSEVCQAKLDSIRSRAIQRRQEDSNKDQDRTEKAAICIQRMWRGYHTRNLNKKATTILKSIEMMRTNKYIQKLSTDMEATRTALESEHKLQLLQMQAINALWKKVVSLQPGGNRENTSNESETTAQPNADVVTNLAQTCNLLHTQVQQLQDSMSEIRRCMSTMQPKTILVDHGVATQTEISAVHTPAGEENTFPYARPNRPQSLPIHQTIHEGNESKSFASNLVDSVLKKVSQSTDTTDDEVNTDILNSNENQEILNSTEHPDMFKSCEEIVEPEFRDVVVDSKITNEYEGIIDNNEIGGEVCEETLCKELHNLIETENSIPNVADDEKQNNTNDFQKEALNAD
ncbi:PREDICTED: centrosomal protein of 97 kDa isoform X3 [Polistes dominula]|uniref:Centrosomal protein of 97 kDa isoform X3 n=1 Tax=Polistes dominula TaxID=743375 RepID=A0ABM1J938_POLDO|nr:PREDICTED: centrosomal protein of 97 kDa isoform X3 [Polistes dominula]